MGASGTAPRNPTCPSYLQHLGVGVAKNYRENHTPTAVPLVTGLASSRAHPAARAKAGPPHFLPASGTPKGPRRLLHCV